MSSVDKKKKIYSLYGSYVTRKWNDEVDIHYFEKKRGGKHFLRKCLSEAKSKDLVFNSSLIDSNHNKPWIEAGWKISKELYLYKHHFSGKGPKNITNKEFQIQKLHQDHFAEIVSLDKEIFETYWRSSRLSLLDTLKSCREAIFYTYKEESGVLAYAIVGVTMRSSFLQRFAVHPKRQGVGIGSLMIENVLKDMNRRKMISMKLNTQPENKAAQRLYEKNSFILSNKRLLIMGSS